MIRSSQCFDRKFSREFCAKNVFYFLRHTHIFITCWLSGRYKNTLFFAKISPKEVFVQKNRFSEPVFCQKTQQWEDAAHTRQQVSFLLLSFLCFFLLFYLFTFLPLSYFLHLHQIIAFDLYDDEVELRAVEHCLQLTVGGVGLDLRDGIGPLLGSLSVGSVGLEILQL